MILLIGKPTHRKQGYQVQELEMVSAEICTWAVWFQGPCSSCHHIPVLLSGETLQFVSWPRSMGLICWNVDIHKKFLPHVIFLV